MFTESAMEELEAAEALGSFLQAVVKHWSCYMCGRRIYSERDVCWDHWSGDDYLVPGCRPCADKSAQKRSSWKGARWSYGLCG